MVSKQNVMNGKEALARLLEGNRRFSLERPVHPNQTTERRREVLEGQRPFAVILGCSDSRVPPEVLFDQGIGDLFVIRTAGHVVGTTVLASLEYAVSHLRVPLIMVLAHSDCGAVKATIASEGEPPGGHLHYVAEAIQPAVDKAADRSGELTDQVIRTHGVDVAQALRSRPPVLSTAVDAGELTIVAAYYSLETGGVDILS